MSKSRSPRYSRWIGERIRAVRHARGVSRGLLARQIGVSDWQVTKYELGTDRVSFEVMLDLVEALGVSLDEFRPPAEVVEAGRKRSRIARDPLLRALRAAAASAHAGRIAE